MIEKPKAIEIPLVKCEVCLTEIPQSEARCAEAEDYVLHFCGLDCYREWAARAAAKEQEGRRAQAR